MLECRLTLCLVMFSVCQGVFTRLCPRYLSDVPDGACFCSSVASSAGPMVIPSGGDLPLTRTLVAAMVENLGLSDIYPPTDRPALGLLSRENKRFILNELELAKIAVEMGVSIKLLPLEYMTIYEQIREFRRLHFLAGIHGSGLTNYFFLHTHGGPHESGLSGLEPGGSIQPDSLSALSTDAGFAHRLASKRHFINYCLQLMPHMVRIGGEGLRGFAQQAECAYEEWIQPKRENTVLHTHFLNGQDYSRLEQLMARVKQHTTTTHTRQDMAHDTCAPPDSHQY